MTPPQTWGISAVYQRPSHLLIIGIEGAADVVGHLLKGHRIAVARQEVQR
jgi:hypothetical protein